MSLFGEKVRDSLKRSAAIFTSDWSWWSFKLAGMFNFGSDLFKSASKEGTGMVGFIFLWPVLMFAVYIALPIINLVANVGLAFLNTVSTPVIASVLSLVHVIKDFVNSFKVDAAYEKLSSLDDKDFNQYVVNAINDYEPASEASQRLKYDIINKSPTDAKVAIFTFFKQSAEDYNAGRGIAQILLSAKPSEGGQVVETAEEQLAKQRSEERDAERARITSMR